MEYGGDGGWAKAKGVYGAWAEAKGKWSAAVWAVGEQMGRSQEQGPESESGEESGASGEMSWDMERARKGFSESMAEAGRGVLILVQNVDYCGGG